MRVNRAKQVRKWLRFYRIVYGVAPPYMVRFVCALLLAQRRNSFDMEATPVFLKYRANGICTCGPGLFRDITLRSYLQYCCLFLSHQAFTLTRPSPPSVTQPSPPSRYS